MRCAQLQHLPSDAPHRDDTCVRPQHPLGPVFTSRLHAMRLNALLHPSVWLLLVGLAACGGGGDGLVSPPVPPPVPVPVPDGSTLRLLPSGRQLLDPSRQPVLLHGANLRDNLTTDGASTPILTQAEADDLALNLHANFVRLRISWEQGNRDDNDPSGLSTQARQYLADAIALLRARHIWTLLEMRTSDAVANSPALYTTTSSTFAQYRKVWTWLASTYGGTDYIAGYGLLAEPSPNRAGLEPVSSLVTFYSALMAAIAPIDARTPFFIGTAFNYDTMGFRWDAYFTDPQLVTYQPRLVYEVNVLSPKPWIDSASLPPGTDPAAMGWPQAAATDFTPLITAAPGENLQMPDDQERIFGRRSQEPALFPKLMSKAYLQWYLGFAADFAARHQVPMVVDQFGATTNVNAYRAGQQLVYEQDVIDVAEAYQMGWCRWVYSNGAKDRSIAGNPDVYNFYAAIGAARGGP